MAAPSPAGSLACAALALAASVIQPARAAPAETAEAFVRRVYARYRAGGPDVSTSRPGGTAFYATDLLDAFAKDEELAHGEVGAVDGDPLCGCQDHGNLQVRAVAVSADGAGRAKARVTFRTLGTTSTVLLTLVKTPPGWRIADVGDENTASLVALLRESNAHPIQDPAPPQPRLAPATPPR